MRYLLDTHVLLWWLDDDRRMGATARATISDPANDVLVSVVSLWELTIKQRIGKVAVEPADIAAALPQEGFGLLGVTVEHLLALRHLPSHHRDPFDQLMIAQALAEGAVFISEDRAIRRYPVRVMRFSE